MSIAAIETRYAGHRFRSRLEARWAVFFDALEIKWEYEAQGYEVNDRLEMGVGSARYLPDFWLPELGIHAEVKGVLDNPAKILSHYASVLNDEGGCGGSGLLLGPIPRPGESRLPTLLHMHKGQLIASPWLLVNADPHLAMHAEVANDAGQWDMLFPESLLDGVSLAWLPWVTKETLRANPAMRGLQLLSAAERGYVAARSARFEHGEVPAL